MILDLAKALFLMFSITSLLEAALHAFFVPGTRFAERIFATALYLMFSASVCVFSGLLFAWPSPENPDRDQRFFTTLPVRLFLWSSLGIVVLFLSSWYLGDLVQQASPFISDRSLQRF